MYRIYLHNIQYSLLKCLEVQASLKLKTFTNKMLKKDIIILKYSKNRH